MPLTAFRLDLDAERVATVTFDLLGSKANTLGQAVLGELEELLTQLEKTPDLRGVLFQSGKPGMFIAGADLKELGDAKGTPERSRELVRRGLDVIARLEKLPCPTVALIDGACVGGGLELVLGFDFRLAGSHPKVEIGCPETKIGLIPGWGGTQRMSRVIGPALAVELIAAGDNVSATRARDIGLIFDAVPSERLAAEGRRLIDEARKTGSHLEARRRKREPVGLSEEQSSFLFAVARGQVQAKTKGQFPAPLAAIDAIEKGCNLPLDDGLKVETEAFVPLVGSPISRNLITLFFLTQRLAKDPGVTDAKVQPKPVERVAVFGAGLMGAGIAGAHVRRGVPAVMIDVGPPPLEKGVAAITKSLQGRVEIGRMKPEEVVQSLSRLTPTTSHALVSECDVVIEAVIEKEDAKTALYRDIASKLKPGAILASNTSTISITRMAAAAPAPERFAGMHFFNPVDRMQLVEVIRGDKTNDETVVTLVALAKRLGKSPIVIRDCPGFLVNRILFPYLNEALALLEEGASPRELDAAAVAFGLPMGPITLSDVVGLDTTLYAGKVLETAYADRARPSPILGALVKAGRLGQKSGAGFYSYAKGSRGVDDPAFEAILAPLRTGKKSFTREELTDRLFLPMLTEATRVLAEGIVRDPADIDMGLILGIGWPTFRGGLLRWAESLGAEEVMRRLARYHSLGERFRVPEAAKKLLIGK
jgi:3-hydroxyacyl-CoA dehydrogenase/enoyl-CoA hydratase/3-hydroxybutyryl-CoA epimerase/3-hydroxyacyl-CoA dehydrogenase/enoyl-CoA hydratase/3-hydroxybutyryl-CoA epimerase/enoyl-CoA isomerase